MNTKLNEEIIDIIKSKKDGLSFRKIQDQINDSPNLSRNDQDNLSDVLHDILTKLEREEIIKRVPNPKGTSTQKSFYKFYKKRVTRPKGTVEAIAEPETRDTILKGCAGEYAVMSELLFRGFDVNLMVVDKGQDIIAQKDGEWYFIQVKTTNLDSNKRASWDIPRVTLNKFFDNTKMRYILVARCLVAGKHQNRYFCFDNSEISFLIHDGKISVQNNNISIKIRYENEVPYIYDKQKQDASRWESFDSIIGRQI